MDKDRILSILEVIPKEILIKCAERLLLENKKIRNSRKNTNSFNRKNVRKYNRFYQRSRIDI